MVPQIGTHTHTHIHKGGFMEASGDMLWTGFERFSDMCGLKLAQLENAFHLCVHPSLSVPSSPAVSISSPDLSCCQGLLLQHSILHTHHMLQLTTARPHKIRLLSISIIKRIQLSFNNNHKQDHMLYCIWYICWIIYN